MSMLRGDGYVGSQSYFNNVFCDADSRSEEHTSELQSHSDLVCRLLLEKKTANPDPTLGKTRTDYNTRAAMSVA